MHILSQCSAAVLTLNFLTILPELVTSCSVMVRGYELTWMCYSVTIATSPAPDGVFLSIQIFRACKVGMNSSSRLLEVARQVAGLLRSGNTIRVE